MARRFGGRLWLPSLLGRFTFLLFILSVLVFLFYVVGNTQGFTDATLLLLFDVEIVVLSLGIFSVLAYVVLFFLHSRLMLIHILFSAFAFLFFLALYFGVALLRAFMRPYGM